MNRIELLFFLRDPFPTHRVDVDVLFGRELLSRGHAIDFVAQAARETQKPGPVMWHGRTVWVGPTEASRSLLGHVRLHLRSLLHDLRFVRIAVRPRYRGVQVRDKFFIGAIFALLARARDLKFFFWLSWPFAEAEQDRAAARTARYPWIANLRGKLTGWLLYGVILPRADHVFVQSERMKRDVCARGVDPHKVTSVPMGIDDAVLALAPATRHTPFEARSANVLAYVGTLSADRQLEILIDMLAQLVREGIDVRLVMIGGSAAPGDQERLESRARVAGVRSRIEFTGMLPRTEALARLQSADVALSPIPRSRMFDVGSPTKLIEYLALGIPVVANDHPEQALVLAATRAGVCTPWSARHFARAAKFLLSRTSEQRADMSARGREWVRENRVYSRIATDVERVYLAVQDGRRIDARVL